MGALLFLVTAAVTVIMLSAIERRRMARLRQCVLVQLAIGDRFGSDLVSGSGGRLSRSACYVVLGDMERLGVIAGRYVVVDRGLMPRRLYSITEVGRAEIRA